MVPDTIFSTNSDSYNNVKEFTTSVKGGLGAKDISSNTFTVDKSDKQAGDIIILTSPYNHIASYSSVNPNKLTYENLDSNGNPISVKTTSDWSNASTDGRGNSLKYYPNKTHINRWNMLNVKSSQSDPFPEH